jgi:L-arabinose transport system substrate-binding protein
MKNVKRFFLTVLLVLAMAIIFAGCSNDADPVETTEALDTLEESNNGETSSDKTKPADDSDIVIAGIYKSGDQQWFIGEGQAAAAKVKEMGAKDFIYVDVKLDPDLYLQAIDNAITQNVAGILTCPPDQKLSEIVVQKAKDAGIPIIACDDALQDEDGNLLAPFVGIDAYAIGKAVGEWGAEYAKNNDMTGEDTGLLLLAADQVTSCVPRTEGQLEVWKTNFPEWPEDRIWRVDYEGPQEKAYDAAAGTFTANPHIKKWVIMAINDEGAAGATRALEQAGMDDNAVVIGIGGYLAKLEFQKQESTAFKATAFINYVDIGEYAAENIMNYLLNGMEIPMDTRTPAVIVTAENYLEIMKDQAE